MKKLIFLIPLFSLISCGEAIYTVEDFKNDKELRDLFIEKCNNGELRYDDQNCINAKSTVKFVIGE